MASLTHILNRSPTMLPIAIHPPAEPGSLRSSMSMFMCRFVQLASRQYKPLPATCVTVASLIHSLDRVLQRSTVGPRRVLRALILHWPPRSWQTSNRLPYHQTGLRPDSLVAVTSTLVVARHSPEDRAGVALRLMSRWMGFLSGRPLDPPLLADVRLLNLT